MLGTSTKILSLKTEKLKIPQSGPNALREGDQINSNALRDGNAPENSRRGFARRRLFVSNGHTVTMNMHQSP